VFAEEEATVASGMPVTSFDPTLFSVTVARVSVGPAEPARLAPFNVNGEPAISDEISIEVEPAV
jgi:hypothetical protein